MGQRKIWDTRVPRPTACRTSRTPRFPIRRRRRGCPACARRSSAVSPATARPCTSGTSMSSSSRGGRGSAPRSEEPSGVPDAEGPQNARRLSASGCGIEREMVRGIRRCGSGHSVAVDDDDRGFPRRLWRPTGLIPTRTAGSIGSGSTDRIVAARASSSRLARLRAGRSCFRPPADGAVSQSSYVIVTDADAHHARALAAGAVVVMAPADKDYGGRGYGCRYPERNLRSFGSCDPSQDEPPAVNLGSPRRPARVGKPRGSRCRAGRLCRARSRRAPIAC